MLAFIDKVWYIHYTKHCPDERITVQGCIKVR